MNVTKCDTCGKIVGNDEAFKLDITSLKPRGNKTERLCRLEICADCKSAVYTTLKIKEAEV